MNSVGAVIEGDNPLLRRYEDAYRVASALVKRGRILKIIGSILAGGLSLVATLSLIASLGGASLSGVASRPRSPFGTGFDGGVAGPFLVLGGMATFVLAVCGIGFGATLFEWGTSLSARGQLLQAQLDTAVHTSPFLREEEKREILGVPARENVGPMDHPAGQRSLGDAQPNRPDESVEGRTITCPQCAVVNPSGNQYCESCGHKLRV